MKYSTLIRSKRDASEVISEILNDETKPAVYQQFMLYAPSLLQLTSDLTSRLKVIPANKVVLKDIFMVLLSMDTIRSTEMFEHLPEDIVIIIPDCDRYLRFIGVELTQSVLNQLMYQGVRLFFISEGDEDDKTLAVNKLEFESELVTT